MLCNFLWVFTFWDFSFLNQSYNLTVSLKVNLIIVHFHYKMGLFPKSWGQTAWGPFKLYQIICESLNRFDAQLIYLKRGMKEVMSCQFSFPLTRKLALRRLQTPMVYELVKFVLHCNMQVLFHPTYAWVEACLRHYKTFKQD